MLMAWSSCINLNLNDYCKMKTLPMKSPFFSQRKFLARSLFHCTPQAPTELTNYNEEYTFIILPNIHYANDNFFQEKKVVLFLHVYF